MSSYHCWESRQVLFILLK